MKKSADAASGIANVQLADQIRIRCQERDSGELLIRAAGQQWRLYFFMGRLLFGLGDPRVRRWQRLWHQSCPYISWQELQTLSVSSSCYALWEYDLLGQLVDCGRINIDQAKTLIQSSIVEIIVAVGRFRSVKFHWDPKLSLDRQIYLFAPDQVWQAAQEQVRTELDPDAVMRLANPELFRGQVSPVVFQALNQHLDGTASLWQVAQRMGKPFPLVCRSLMPFVKQGWLVPAPVGDLPLPTTWSPPATGAMPKPQLPLIACIDDSPTVGKAMEFILTALGYEALVIMDPLNAITALHKSKPVLIFLDLLMPHTNGYELCASLRRTTLFRDVPIIILNCHPDFFSPQPKNPASWATQHFSIAQRCRSRGRYGGGLI